jgi:hypothetical protein
LASKPQKEELWIFFRRSCGHLKQLYEEICAKVFRCSWQERAKFGLKKPKVCCGFGKKVAEILGSGKTKMQHVRYFKRDKV